MFIIVKYFSELSEQTSLNLFSGFMIRSNQTHTTRSFQCKADKITLAMLKLKHYYNIFEKQNKFFSIFKIRL